ncbi:MAG: RNA polymerase sigma factor [Chloroflexi bacterium]|nr:RNA polymerase sigma factor [Chloroflexota bacterium]
MNDQQQTTDNGQQTLITYARQGDTSAWETLVGQHQEAVFRLAYLLLGDADEAKDAAQETFIRAFRSLHQFDSARPMRPWLLKITTNLVYNRRRAIGRYLAALQRLVRLAPEPVLTPAPDETLPQEDTQLLWQAVRRLNPADQEIIYLRYFLELSVAETAETAGIAPGTVKSRLSRALERLRQVVEREFPSLWKERVA